MGRVVLQRRDTEANFKVITGLLLLAINIFIVVLLKNVLCSRLWVLLKMHCKRVRLICTDTPIVARLQNGLVNLFQKMLM